MYVIALWSLHSCLNCNSTRSIFNSINKRRLMYIERYISYVSIFMPLAYSLGYKSSEYPGSMTEPIYLNLTCMNCILLFYFTVDQHLILCFWYDYLQAMPIIDIVFAITVPDTNKPSYHIFSWYKFYVFHQPSSKKRHYVNCIACWCIVVF